MRQGRVPPIELRSGGFLTATSPLPEPGRLWPPRPAVARLRAEGALGNDGPGPGRAQELDGCSSPIAPGYLCRFSRPQVQGRGGKDVQQGSGRRDDGARARCRRMRRRRRGVERRKRRHDHRGRGCARAADDQGDGHRGRHEVRGPSTSAPAGPVEITLESDVKDGADAQLLYSDGSHSDKEIIGELAKAMEGGAVEDWFVPAGGPGQTAKGESTTVTQVLEPGTYLVVGGNNLPKGEPAKFEVTEGEEAAPPPEADGTHHRHRLRVRRRGAQGRHRQARARQRGQGVPPLPLRAPEAGQDGRRRQEVPRDREGRASLRERGRHGDHGAQRRAVA